MASFIPAIGTWYQDLSSSSNFEIVAVDENQGTIEVQYDNGDITEYDIESWGRLNIITLGKSDMGFDSIEHDKESQYANDFSDNYGGSNGYLYNYSNPIESIEPDSFNGFDDLF